MFPKPLWLPNGQKESTMRANPVKRALREGQPALGTWLSLGSITAARFLARAGWAWLTVDMEHSLVDWETATHIFGSVADAGCVALARVPANRHDHIKRVLDNGAHGVVVPMVNTRAEAEAARMRIEEGWQFLAIGSELRMMLAGSSDELKKLGNLKKGDLAKY